jgi:hypothetical protein
MGTGLLAGLKWPGVVFTTASSAEVKESVQLYLYTIFLDLYGLF